ncbi:AraC-like DNA-binding protein [Nitrobacteraceae bacterium AZCC 2161]
MTKYVALDVSQEVTAVCVVDETGRITAEKKIATCPETISFWLSKNAPDLVRVGMETGPLAVWLWNELRDRGIPIVCMDARHAHAALKMRPNKTDRNDAAGLAQIVRTGWFKHVRIKSRDSYEVRSLLAAREVLVRTRVKLENEIRGLLRTFGVLFGKASGGFALRAEEIVAGELDASAPMRVIVETLMQARVVAKALVVHHRRAGGQSQHSALLELDAKSDRVQDALLFARRNLHAPLSVELLAEAARLSPRQFSRVFHVETGQSPAKAIENLRLEAARLALEQGRRPVEEIAKETGFGDRERMRRAFLRAFGQTPQAIRNASHPLASF